MDPLNNPQRKLQQQVDRMDGTNETLGPMQPQQPKSELKTQPQLPTNGPAHDANRKGFKAHLQDAQQHAQKTPHTKLHAQQENGMQQKPQQDLPTPKVPQQNMQDTPEVKGKKPNIPDLRLPGTRRPQPQFKPPSKPKF